MVRSKAPLKTHSMTQDRDANKRLASVVSSFMPYIERKISGLSLPGLDRDDLRQEAYVALFSAIESYDGSRGAGFSTYAITCINNRLADTVRRASSGKNKVLNESLSLSDDDDPQTVMAEDSPEEAAIVREEYLRVLERMDALLSDLERESLMMYASGYSYAEIAEKINTTPKAVSNAIQRARKKLKKE